MKLTLELTIQCASEDAARSLERVLAPDNKSVPKDQVLTKALDGDTLRFAISSTRASSCVSSALGILADAKLFAEVWVATA